MKTYTIRFSTNESSFYIRKKIASYKRGRTTFSSVMAFFSNIMNGKFFPLMKFKYGISYKTVVGIILGTFIPSIVFQHKIISFILKLAEDGFMQFTI